MLQYLLTQLQARRDDEGATAVEYGLMVGLIAADAVEQGDQHHRHHPVVLSGASPGDGVPPSPGLTR